MRRTICTILIVNLMLSSVALARKRRGHRVSHKKTETITEPVEKVEEPTAAPVAEESHVVEETPEAETKEPVVAPVTAPVESKTQEDWSGFEEIKSQNVQKEDESASWYSEAYPVADRTLDLLTARTLRQNTWMIVVAHRNQMPLKEKPFDNFLGYDGGGLKIGLGLRYGIIKNLDMGLYRVNGTSEIFDTYEADVRYQLLQQEQHSVDVALRFGGTWFYQPDQEDASGTLGQLLITRLFFNRLLLSAGALFHSNSSNDTKTLADDNHSFAVFGAAEFRFMDRFAWDVEVAHSLVGYGSEWPLFTTGCKVITNRHTFAFVFSNTQYMSADGVVSNTNRRFKDGVLGFNITREL